MTVAQIAITAFAFTRNLQTKADMRRVDPRTNLLSDLNSRVTN